MKLAVRGAIDRAFTALTGLSVVLMCLVLVAVLGPMIWRGAGAILFEGTVEFRKMQLAIFERGDASVVEREMRQTDSVRKYVYDTIDRFRKGINTEALTSEARKIHREFGKELRNKGVQSDEYTQLRSISRDIRDKLESAFASRDIERIRDDIEYVLKYEGDARFEGTLAKVFFRLAKEFRAAAENADLTRHYEYANSLAEVEDIIARLLGPKPGQPAPALVRLRYGATRWDQAQKLLDEFLWAERWVAEETNRPLVRVRDPRVEQFAGTILEPLFDYVPENLTGMLKPSRTFYWQYFIDDNVNSHYFGGIGPEILGTLVITVLGMLFTIPLGIVSAAYLVECASDNIAVRTIRMCINTLAGVPSIVFGLFGLAFFVLFLFPLLGFESKPCILAASLTLAVLTLPVMIRASEEAIRAVPQTYKEASLALGASRFRTFVTVIFPAALPGILTGMILSLSRIAGETAPILFTGAVALGPLPKSIFDPTRTLSYGSYDMAVGDRLAMMVPHNQYGMVVTLVVLILGLNTVAIVLRSRVFKKLKGH